MIKCILCESFLIDGVHIHNQAKEVQKTSYARKYIVLRCIFNPLCGLRLAFRHIVIRLRIDQKYLNFNIGKKNEIKRVSKMHQCFKGAITRL